MPEIKISISLWNQTSEEEKAEITKHLVRNKLMKPGDTIVGDQDTPAPSPDATLYGMKFGEFKPEGWPGTDLCKIACDAAAAAATVSLPLTGPALMAAVAAIAAARDACRNGC